MEPEVQAERSFVRGVVPWLVAGGALLVYLVTLNGWVTLTSLPVVAKVAGWDWASTLPTPLLYLVTWPFRLFPPGLQPVALNGLSAVCAALALALLARSVTLLPHDRTREQRTRERSEFSLLSIDAAWIPPLLAVMVCGLQLTFWEHATSATGEMLDLLLFAYVIRCLLEHRLDERESWIWQMALVYGLAVANNWAMLGYFPAFLLALVWIKGGGFFDLGFIFRTVCFGLGGLLLYLLLPAVTILSEGSTLGFWGLLRTYCGMQKNFLLSFPKYIMLLCGLTSLLPVLVMGIRWPSTFGDTSVVGAMLTNLMFHVVHGVFLVAGVWVAFDPPFGPRVLGLGMPLLTFYFLGALAIGYFSGYFLLVFGKDPDKSWRRATGGRKFFNNLVTGTVWIGLVAVPVGLLWKNLPSIRGANSPALREFAMQAAQSLPGRGAVILSDDTSQLLLLQAVLNQANPQHQHILLDTTWLPYHVYHRHLIKRIGPRWPVLPLEKLKDPIEPSHAVQLIGILSKSHPVYYLQPCFNLYLEQFHLRPHGLVYQLNPYAANVLSAPGLDQDEFTENENFWSRFSRERASSIARLSEHKVAVGEVLGRYYSRAMNFWGVRLQQANRLEEARKHFQTAIQLFPDNFAASVNLALNDQLRSGKPVPSNIKESVELKKYRRWDEFLQVCGPVDEPNFCYNLGQEFSRGLLHRQAAQQFLRARTLNPENVNASFWQANMCFKAGMHDLVLALVSELRAQKTTALSLANQIELLSLEAWAYFAKKDLPSAEKLLLDSHRKYPLSPEILDTLSQIYFMAKDFTNALVAIDKQLLLATNNVQALMNKGAAYIKINAYDKAIGPLNRVLELDPKNTAALLNRAIAYRLSGRLDAATKDYEALEKQMNDEPAVHYGLGEIAYQRKEKSTAIERFETYLKWATPTSEEIKIVRDRLNELKPGAGGR